MLLLRGGEAEVSLTPRAEGQLQRYRDWDWLNERMATGFVAPSDEDFRKLCEIVMRLMIEVEISAERTGRRPRWMREIERPK